MQCCGSRLEKSLMTVYGVISSRLCVTPNQHGLDHTAFRSLRTLRTAYCVNYCHSNHLHSHKPVSLRQTLRSSLGCSSENHIKSHESVFQLSNQAPQLYFDCYHDDHLNSYKPAFQSSIKTVQSCLTCHHDCKVLNPKPISHSTEPITGPCLGCNHYNDIQSHKPMTHSFIQMSRHCSYNYSHVTSYSNHFGHHSGLLSTCLDHRPNYFTQNRHFSADTYYKYFSPDFPPIGFAQKLFEYIHDTTGLPWWASILFTTFTLRTVITLPLAVHAIKVIAKVELLQPEIKDLSTELKKEVALAVKKFGWQQPTARKMYNATMKKLVRELYVRDNCHPMKASVLALVQLPMWFSLSFALRNMSGAVPVAGLALPVLCPGLLTEGALWFTNLTVPDAFWILPISMGVFNLMNIELHALERSQVNRLQQIITNVMRVISVLMIGVGALVPSSMSLYWSFSSLFGVLQTLAFKSPRVKRILGIPKTPRESDTPYRDLWQRAKRKYTWSKSETK